MSNLFGRLIVVNVAGFTFRSNELEIRMEVLFDDDMKPNVSKIMIYNLSPDTINKLKAGSQMTVSAGYTGDIGVVCQGKVQSVIPRWDGLDKVTTLTIIEGHDYTSVKVTQANASPAKVTTTTTKKKGASKNTSAPPKKALNITFKANTKASTIIKHLSGVLGIKVAVMKLPKDAVYKKGYVVTGQIINNLEEVVRDCGATMYYRRGSAVIRSIHLGDDEKFLLKEETGLLNVEPFDQDGKRMYRIKCLLQHRITVASIIDVQHSLLKGKCRVIRGSHTADENDFITEIEVD